MFLFVFFNENSIYLLIIIMTTIKIGLRDQLGTRKSDKRGDAKGEQVEQGEMYTVKKKKKINKK